MAYVNVTAEVSLDEFESDAILDAALDIVKAHLKKPDPWIAEKVSALRLLFNADDGSDDEPLSTAATLKDPFDLKRWVEDGPGKALFHFASTPTQPEDGPEVVL